MCVCVCEENSVTLSTYMIDLHFFETSIDVLFPLIQRKEIDEYLITNRTCGIVLFDLCDDRIETFPSGIDLHHGRHFRCCLDQSWTFPRRNEIFIIVFIFSCEGFLLRRDRRGRKGSILFGGTRGEMMCVSAVSRAERTWLVSSR